VGYDAKKSVLRSWHWNPGPARGPIFTMTPHRTRFAFIAILLAPFSACECNGDGAESGSENTSEVGGFDGLFDAVADGFNFPFDIAIVPRNPDLEDDEDDDYEGDIIVANYGTSEILIARGPDVPLGTQAEAFYAGPDDGLMGATAVSAPGLGTGEIWTAFEQGGEGGMGGIAILDRDGGLVDILDGADDAGAFANPGGLCYGGDRGGGDAYVFFMINLGDGTAWRIEGPDGTGAGAGFEQVGAGLATGTAGNPGTPGSGITSSNNLPEGGARGCAFSDGSLYVADAQNARIVRFDDAFDGSDLDGTALEDTPAELVTYPTDLSINEDGDLIVISYDNAHAFVSLELPGGGFLDNGLHDLNVNAGNYGVAVAQDTIWFTRANNSNGTLRAVTPTQDDDPSTAGPFPPQ
jgi:hypothetical protein